MRHALVVPFFRWLSWGLSRFSELLLRGRIGHAPKLCPSTVTGIAVRAWPTSYANPDSYPIASA